MSSDAKVLAVLVNWNGGSVLKETVASLLESDYPDLEVLVVDNASTDRSTCQLPDSVKVLLLERNLGYGAAINRVVCRVLDADPAAARLYRYFLVLNNDLIVSRRAVSRLVEFARPQGKVIVGPRIVTRQDPDQLEAAWGEVTWSHVLARFVGKGAAKDAPEWNQPRQVQLILGSAMLIDRDVLNELGPFDEAYFMYHEEVDFLYRANQSGFKVFYLPSAEIQHIGAYSTRGEPDRKAFWLRRNAVYFLRKYRASRRQWLYFFSTLAASIVFNLVNLRIGRARSICLGILAGFRIGLEEHQEETWESLNRRL
jgi:GT2 family glycosyltransferase